MANQDSQARNIGDQFQGDGTNSPIFIMEYDEILQLTEGTLKATQTNIGHAFIWGHPTNSIFGVALGIDGVQITFGAEGLGTTIIQFIVNENNTFKEMLRDNAYVDTTNTTATVNYTTHTITF